RRPVMQEQIMESEKGSAYLGNNARFSPRRSVNAHCYLFVLVRYNKSEYPLQLYAHARFPNLLSTNSVLYLYDFNDIFCDVTEIMRQIIFKFQGLLSKPQ
ncbi:hypothetical protein, partial [Shewanella algae]|uniref:hypothetical protein n=1 Tax=Shewanella algae TaxID=38313 RepID=UPI001C912650